jgi:hypothetical protein
VDAGADAPRPHQGPPGARGPLGGALGVHGRRAARPHPRRGRLRRHRAGAGGAAGRLRHATAAGVRPVPRSRGGRPAGGYGSSGWRSYRRRRTLCRSTAR